ncbi:hypothetical protein RJ640_006596 [Escallonia rubra]|uniref:Uncharacterized protein n=1 Tax=Escallonia rubra TaxID=112253 RepID=A0AA88QZM8_9ASTE|nr:hypothetical protein RJ640_006596 [Escallonia rubra]
MAAKAKATTRLANPAPGHCLLPIPNGTKLCPPFSLPSNLSGLKVVGSSHTARSLCMAHALTSNIVPRGTSNPPTVESSDDSCGTRRGAVGYNRICKSGGRTAESPVTRSGLIIHKKV